RAHAGRGNDGFAHTLHRIPSLSSTPGPGPGPRPRNRRERNVPLTLRSAPAPSRVWGALRGKPESQKAEEEAGGRAAEESRQAGSGKAVEAGSQEAMRKNL